MKAGPMGTPFREPVNQLGCVVADLDKAIQGWVELGVGPWLTMHHVEVRGYQYEGRASKPRIDLALGQNGDLQIELIHPANDEPSDYKDFLDQGRLGIHHLGWFCEDYQGAVAAAAAEGRIELQRGEWSGVHFVYHQPAGGTGVITELIELTGVSRQVFDLVRQEAANWGGKDPVRSLVGQAGWGLRWDAVKGQLSHLLGG
jgi:hypothetical protein